MAKLQINFDYQMVNDDNIINHSPQHNVLNNEALKLISEIVKLPDVPPLERQNFDSEPVWHKHLQDIPYRVQLIIQSALTLNNRSGNLSKANILDNFLKMCGTNGMSFSNPFNLFTMRTKNYDGLLIGMFNPDTDLNP